MERSIQGYRFDDEHPIAVGVSSVTYGAVREGAASVSIPVSIKVINLQSATEDSGSRPNVELLDSSPLRHDCIVDVRDVIRMGQGRVGIVRELVDGPSVAQILDAAGDRPLPPEVALYIGRQAARALAHAHVRNIVHADFCHRHVLVSNDGQVKVSDFQVSSLLARAARAESALRVGKRFFLAPELINRPEALPSPAVDIWALGILVYRMASGHYPFADPDSAAAGLAPDLRLPEGDWGPALAELLSQCLAYLPTDRPTADDVWRSIRRILGPGWPGYGSTELAEFVGSLRVGLPSVTLEPSGSGPRSVPAGAALSGPALRPLPLEPLPEGHLGSTTPGSSSPGPEETRVSRRPEGSAATPRPIQHGAVDVEVRSDTPPDLAPPVVPVAPPARPAPVAVPTPAPLLPPPAAAAPAGPSTAALNERLQRLEHFADEIAARQMFSMGSDPALRELGDRLANLEEANSFLAREVNRLSDLLERLVSGFSSAIDNLDEVR